MKRMKNIGDNIRGRQLDGAYPVLNLFESHLFLAASLSISLLIYFPLPFWMGTQQVNNQQSRATSATVSICFSLLLLRPKR